MDWRFLSVARWLVVVFLCFGPGAVHAAKAAQEARWEELNAGVIEAYDQGAYDQGIALAEEARRVAEEAFGALDERTLTSLNNLAWLYASQGRYGEAQPLYEQALQLRRQVLGESHPDTLASLNNLAFLYSRQGRYGEAQPLYEQALQLSRQVLGESHPDTLQSLNNLAMLYESQGRYGEAQPLLEQALQLRRQGLGESHPDTLSSLNNLAGENKGVTRTSRHSEGVGYLLYGIMSVPINLPLTISTPSFPDQRRGGPLHGFLQFAQLDRRDR
jgi:tetratricopeptide (TPR) repeat protein